MTNMLLLKELSRYPIGTFADIIYRNALLYPDSEAFVSGPQRITFKAYNENVNRIVHALDSQGICKGDHIGILSWNSVAYCEVSGAAMKGGFVLAHFNTRLTPKELIYQINDAEAKVLFVGPELVEAVDAIRNELPKTKVFISIGSPARGFLDFDGLLASHSDAELEPNVEEKDPLIILYTSGTTGEPRGAIYNHAQIMENALLKALSLTVKYGDRALVTMPMFHTASNSHLWPFFLSGGCNVVLHNRSFDPAVTMQTIQDERITDTQLVPTQLIALLNLPNRKSYDLSSLLRVWYASSPMPTEVLKRAIDAFGPIFIQGYGQTESGPDITMLPLSTHSDPKVLASCGRPVMSTHVRIVDEEDIDLPAGEIGEIIVQSRRVMIEYWGRPDDTREALKDGWLRTGDMGYYDERGFIYIADRKKDKIISGGENVFPREVEEVLYTHSAVAEAAVIGIPDDYWVERVHAIVVCKQGEQVTEQELIEHCRQRMAHYKAPKGVEFLDMLPRNAQGKILKRELRAKYWPEK